MVKLFYLRFRVQSAKERIVFERILKIENLENFPFIEVVRGLHELFPGDKILVEVDGV